MKAFKIILNFLPFIAIVFAATFFFRINSKVEIRRPDFLLLGISYFFLFFSFILNAELWRLTLRRFDLKVGFKTAFVSQFKSIFMKYIPGKIWVILGRANIVSQQEGSLQYCSFVSSLLQLITIFSGIVVGISGILIFDLFYVPPAICYAILFVCFLIIIFSVKPIHVPMVRKKGTLKAFQLIVGRKIPPLADIIFLSCFQWILMGTAFYFFIKSIYNDIGLYPILIQPLANNIGIISPFAPGGLGAREGVMIGYLVVGGVSIGNATSISIAARLWFFGGEVVMFIAGYVVKHKKASLIA